MKAGRRRDHRNARRLTRPQPEKSTAGPARAPRAAAILFVCSGFGFLLAAGIGRQMMFVGIGAMFIAIGAAQFRNSNRKNNP